MHTVPSLVLAALALAPLAPLAAAQGEEQAPRSTELQGAVDRAIAAGVRSLLEMQDEDGAWRFSGQPRAGMTALALFALLQSDVPREHDAIRRGLEELARREPPGTYDASLMILALWAYDANGMRVWIDELAQALLAWQRDEGDWGYPEGADLSNTQFAALGLWAAAQAGIDVPDDAWRALADCVMDDYAERDGGFGYTAGAASTLSMTAAGVGTLAICRDRLGARIGEDRAQRMTRCMERGLRWIGRVLSEEPPAAAACYTLYGIERVGALLNASTLGGVAWYEPGAEGLVERQRDDGSFAGRAEGGSDTAFALLFLRRSTRAVVSGSRDPAELSFIGNRDADAEVHVVVGDTAPLTAWITGYGAGARAEAEWPGEEGRGPRVVRVVYSAGETVLGEVAGDPERPCGSERFALRVERAALAGVESGPLVLSARVQVLMPPTRSPSGQALPGPPRWLASRPFPVPLGPELPPDLEQEVRERRANLLTRARPSVRASSEWRPPRERHSPHPAENAVDGRMRTSWLARPSDTRMRLSIELSEPQRADTVLVAHARSTPYQPGFFARAVDLEISLNGEAPHTVRMSSDETVKGRLELPEAVLVRSIEIVLGPAAPGEVQQAVGVAEVQLLLNAR